MTDDAIHFENDGVENGIRSHDFDGKENEVRASRHIGSKANGENPTRIPSNLITLPYNEPNMDDSGPLSPLQINISNNPTKSQAFLRSKQERIRKATAAPLQNRSRVPDESVAYEEGVSLMSELAMVANAEEEQELKRMMAEDCDKNPTILHQSKKLVGYLGGSIRTALQQNLEQENTTDKQSPHVLHHHPDDLESQKTSEDPGVQRINHIVGDLMGKLGSFNPTAMDNGENEQAGVDSVEDDKKSPISEPKSKYWETLMLRSEEVKGARNQLSESSHPPSLLIAKEKSRISDHVDDTPISAESSTPFPEKKTYSTMENSNHFVGHKKMDEASPQSMFSVPMDYSLADNVLETDSPLRVQDNKREEENSPGSSMHNMISAATEIETPLVCKMMSDSAVDSNSIDSSPAVSDFGAMISRATIAQTPNLDKRIDPNVLVQSTATMYGTERKTNKISESYRKNAESLLDKTPITSNKTGIFRNVDSETYLQSDCDMSEDGSIDSLSGESSIKTMGTGQYLTLQKQIRPKLKPTQKMEKNSHRPLEERSAVSPSSLPSLLGSATCNEVSDLESPNIINLPLNFKFSDEESTIHSQSVNEANEANSITENRNRQRLASPHSLMTVTPPSQAACKIYGIPGKENQLHMESPQSLMTVLTPTVGYPPDKEGSLKSKNFKAREDVTSNETPSRAIGFSTPRDRGRGSPHSANTDESFHDAITDEKLSGYSKCLRRCITFGMVVALIGSITVLVIAFKTPSNKDSKMNNNDQESKIAEDNEEWDLDILPATSSPENNIGIPTAIPTSIPTLAPTSIPTFADTSISTWDTIINFEFPPTESPAFGATPSTSSPATRPSLLLRPTTSKAPIQTTGKPTSNPMSIPTFSSEEIQELTWHRIINGENIWRTSDKTPVWFLAADDTPGLELKVINASKDGLFAEKLQNSIDDYGRSKAVSSLELTMFPYEVLCAPPRIGEIKICSGDYGNTDWIGSTILFIRDEYIVSALIRINENTASVASDSILQYELCHQIGHSLGVVHNDANLGLASCMKDFGEDVIVDNDMIGTNEELQHPSSDDLDYLLKLYGPALSTRLRRGR